MRNASISVLLPLIFSSALYAQEPALTFETAEKALLTANPAAAAAAQNLETARLRVTAARAGFYPAFSASASYSRSGSQLAPAGDSYSYGFNGTQPLFAPAVPAALRAANASLSGAQAAYARACSALRYQLRSVFADILNSAEIIKLSQETLRRRTENLELLRLKYQAGRENKAALLETEAILKTAQWQHEKYRKNLRLQERRLNRLLGRAPQTPAPELVLPRPPEPPEDPSVFLPLLKNHHALLAARAALAAAEASADSARSAVLPEASANGNYRWNGSDWPSSLNSWGLGASVSLPLFSGGRLSANLAAANTARLAADQEMKNASDEVYLAAEDAWLAWREARSYMDVAKSSLDAAEARAWLVRKQYLAGQTSYFEWRNVEEQFISEQNQYLAAQRGLILGHAAFAQALGE
ncbi:MAG TPA: TolC family protein [Elusimicrobiales bacterium]|nr:TolC family protein [Elusimicrobiales bacterium]